MGEIEQLVDELFAKRWTSLHNNLNLIDDIGQPGVYLLAYWGHSLEGKEIGLEQVYYVGETKRAAGMRGRLREFLRGIENGKSHSGAMRFFREVLKETPFSEIQTRKKFWIASISLPCKTKKDIRRPDDIRTMGKVVCLERYVIARIKEETGNEPWLNKA